MIIDKSFTALAFVLILGLLLFAVPRQSESEPLPPTGLGCCGALGDSCILCETGDCAFLEPECEEQGAAFFIEGTVCSLESQLCTNNIVGTGCCVLTRASCDDELPFEVCDQAGGSAWFEGASCSEIPRCEPVVRNIPTLSLWSVAALIAVLAIIGFVYMRRGNQTNSTS